MPIEQTLTVKENGKLELHAPELHAGAVVKVTVEEIQIAKEIHEGFESLSDAFTRIAASNVLSDLPPVSLKNGLHF